MKHLIPVPQGLEIPDGTKEGDTLDFLSTYRVEANGKLCLTEIDGMPVDGYKESDKGEKPQPDFEQSYSQNAPQDGMMPEQ